MKKLPSLKKWPGDWQDHIIHACYSYFDNREQDLFRVSFDAAKKKNKHYDYIFPENVSLVTTFSYKGIDYFSYFTRNKSSVIVTVYKVVCNTGLEQDCDNIFPDGTGKLRTVFKIQIDKWAQSDPFSIVKSIEFSILNDQDDNPDNNEDIIPDPPSSNNDKELPLIEEKSNNQVFVTNVTKNTTKANASVV